MKKQIKFLAVAFLITAAFVGGASSAEAKSASWNNPDATSGGTIFGLNYDSKYCNGPDNTSNIPSCESRDIDVRTTFQETHRVPKYIPVISLNSINVTVQHVATVYDQTQNIAVTDNSTVQVNDILKITAADTASDISWVGTGGSNDSPYGNWGGSGTTCATNSQDYAYSGAGLGTTFFNVNYAFDAIPTTPVVTSTGSATLSCNGLTCTVMSAGTIGLKLTYPQTTGKFYAAYTRSGSVNPPSADWSGPGGDVNGCHVLQYPLVIGARFTPGTIDPATGMRVYTDITNDAPIPADYYSLAVPAIPLSFSMSAVNPVLPPTAPVVTPPASCTTNTGGTYSFTGTDPSSNTIRYGVDWNNDGVVDEWVPASGYVNSGTAQTDSHTWLTAGSHAFQVLTQNSTGSSSGWTASSISCTDPLANLTATTGSAASINAGQTAAMNGTITNSGLGATGSSFNNLFQITKADQATVVDNVVVIGGPLAANGGTQALSGTTSYTFATAGTYYYRLCADLNASWVGTISESNEGDNCGTWSAVTVSAIIPPAPVCSLSASPASAPSTLTWSATNNPTTCTGGGFTAGSPPSGIASVSINGTYTLSCSNAGGTCSTQSVTVGATCLNPTATITASVARVHPGATTVITYNATGVASTCNVTGPGAPGVVTSNACMVNNFFTTPPITAQTTYTITCGAASNSVTINVLPKFKEF
jgi:hypothetical protein